MPRRARASDGNRNRAPGTCDCGKRCFGTEADALGAASRSARAYGKAFRAYKCPGHHVWHVTSSRGFRPRALTSRARILAWHLGTRRVTTRASLYRKLNLDPDSREAQKVRSVIREFARLGLVDRDVPERGWLTVTADGHDGLVRITQVGLEEYARSRGTGAGRQGANRAGVSGRPGHQETGGIT